MAISRIRYLYIRSTTAIIFVFLMRYCFHPGLAFMIGLKTGNGPTATSQYVPLNALTERQIQFWEDVEEGLDDIEQFYAKKGQDIDRVRNFGKRARGEIPLEIGDAPGHEPSEEHIEGLTVKPFWDATENSTAFPWAKALEENSAIIMEEFEAKLNRDEEVFSADSVWQNQVMGTGWSAIRLQRLGTWNVENCREYPKTVELLKNLAIPLAVRGVCFARQAPGSGVQPHSDGRNFILTSHLGLKVPDGCWIKVGNEKRHWQQGKLTTLDTSFLHTTANNSTEYRDVLIIDFWHPELSEAEKAALTFVYDLRNKFESGQIPFRKPKSSMEESGAGIGGWWKNLVSGGS